MAYLARIYGDDIQAPMSTCSAGFDHFISIDVPEIEVRANPRRPLTRYLKRLLGKAAEEINSIKATERVNLLYNGDEDNLTIDAGYLLSGNEFSFFVEGAGREKKFVYQKGRIYVDGEMLVRIKRVSDYFDGAKILKLSYIGSPEAELVQKDDYDILDERERRSREKHTARVRAELEKAHLDPAIADEGLMCGRVLLALYFDDDNDESVYPGDIVDDLSREDVECECYYLDNNAEEEIKAVLANLAGQGFVRKANGGYVLSAEHRRNQIKGQLEKYFIGLDNLADAADLTDAGIVLALENGTLRARDVQEYMKRRGYETDIIGSRLFALAGEGILATDDYKEFGIVPELIRMTEDPRQFRLPF